ncbi:hypothetical protein J1614_007943 [Plenodomus biglobosus]|nr:hypothetical protein J1614_007943 [Plenodomus biglobosus]
MTVVNKRLKAAPGFALCSQPSRGFRLHHLEYREKRDQGNYDGDAGRRCAGERRAAGDWDGAFGLRLMSRKVLASNQGVTERLERTGQHVDFLEGSAAT